MKKLHEPILTDQQVTELRARFKEPEPMPRRKSLAIPEQPPGPRLLNLADAATYLGVRVWTLRQMARKLEIPLVQVGRSRRYLIDRVDLDRYIEKNKIGALD